MFAQFLLRFGRDSPTGSCTRHSGRAAQGAGGVQSVARALSILELFNDRRLELTTNEIAQLTGLNRGTTYRFCRTLLSLGYLEEVEPSTFRPGVKCISLAQAALGSRAIIQIAMPFLNTLRDRVQASINMAILDGSDIVYVVRLLGSDLVTLRLGVGSRMPAYATSLGRSILAFLPPEEAASILDHSDLQALTHGRWRHARRSMPIWPRSGGTDTRSTTRASPRAFAASALQSSMGSAGRSRRSTYLSRGH